MIFKSMPQLEKYLEVQIEHALLNKVTQDVAKIAEVLGQAFVYGVHTPTEYGRRYGTGRSLIDPVNFEGKMENGTLVIKNIAQASLAYGGRFDKTVKNLAELVEFGHGYKGMKYSYSSRQGSPYKEPRPFIGPTRDELAKGGTLKAIMKKRLKEQGLTVI